MNKVLSLVLVLMLCVAMSAMAEEVASPTPAPVNGAVVYTAATYPAVNLATPEATEEATAVVNAIATQGVEAYFGADVAALVSAISTGKLASVGALALTDYDASIGDVTVTLGNDALKAVPAGQKVAVAIGVPAGTTYTWSVVEGISDGNGGVQFTIPASILATMNGVTAMVAVFA